MGGKGAGDGERGWGTGVMLYEDGRVGLPFVCLWSVGTWCWRLRKSVVIGVNVAVVVVVLVLVVWVYYRAWWWWWWC